MPDPTDSLRWPAWPWTGPSYVLQGTCGNCERTALVYVQRGHEAPGYRNGPECPYCGCSRWVGCRAPEDAPQKDMLAGLRAAAQIPHAPIADDAPSEDAVEVMARTLCETSGDLLPWNDEHGPQWEQDERIDRDHYRAMARAALSAIGGREASLDAAVMELKAALEDECGTLVDNVHRVDAAWAAVDAALALTPTDAAQAVRELAEAARTALRDFGLVNEAIANQVMPGLHPFTQTPRALGAALRPFGGAGDAASDHEDAFDWAALEHKVDDYLENTPTDKFLADLREAGIGVVDLTSPAQAVRELVREAQAALRDLEFVNTEIRYGRWEGHEFTQTPPALRAALQPFVGEGDA